MHSLLPVCQNRKFKIEEEPTNKYVGGQSINLNNTVVASLFSSANVTKAGCCSEYVVK